MAGFDTILGLDHHIPSVETFRKNHPSSAMIVGDIRGVPDEMVLEQVCGRPVHVITAGVPCQGFSLNNRKRWDEDDRNLLFREFIRFINLLQPSCVLLENVTGLAMAANGDFKRLIAGAIADSGYKVGFTALNAADFGVPQKRQRVFFLGTRGQMKVRWPHATHGARTGKPYRTVWDAIGDLPPLLSGECGRSYATAPQNDFQELMRLRAPKELANHVAPNHPQEVIDMIERTAPGEPMYARFKQRIRLHPDQPSPTQVSGGIRPQFQFGHPNKPRGLTVRERCRLQSFPDDYIIEGGTVQGRVQTGNAVPPLLAFAIARQIDFAFRGISGSDAPSEDEVCQMTLFD